jgi:hypothetical protein
VRASAVDADGIAGMAVRSEPIRVVAVDLPAGALAAGDTLWLLPGQRVKLLGADGLEMTYGAANRYFVGGRATSVLPALARRFSVCGPGVTRRRPV